MTGLQLQGQLSENTGSGKCPCKEVNVHYSDQCGCNTRQKKPCKNRESLFLAVHYSYLYPLAFCWL